MDRGGAEDQFLSGLTQVPRTRAGAAGVEYGRGLGEFYSPVLPQNARKDEAPSALVIVQAGPPANGRRRVTLGARMSCSIDTILCYVYRILIRCIQTLADLKIWNTRTGIRGSVHHTLSCSHCRIEKQSPCTLGKDGSLCLWCNSCTSAYN